MIPFAGMVLIMFGFAVDDTGLMQRIAPGLIVLATVFALLVLVQRAFVIETEDRRARRPAEPCCRLGDVLGQDPGARRPAPGRGGAARARHPPLRSEVRPSGAVLLVTTWVVATLGLAAVGTLYGGLAAGARGRETLLPLLLLWVGCVFFFFFFFFFFF